MQGLQELQVEPFTYEEANEDTSLFGDVTSWFSTARDTLLIRSAMRGGQRDANQLTNLVFFNRHPERQGRGLTRGEPNFDKLANEWLDIRNRLVRPLLDTAPTTPTRPSTPSTGGIDVERSLALLGYDLSPAAGGLTRTIRDFQNDLGVPLTSKVDSKTQGVLSRLLAGWQNASARPGALTRFSRFRLTTYYVVNESDFSGAAVVPVLDAQGKVLARVSPRFFLSMSVEGTGRLSDGRLLNVDGKRQTVTAYREYDQVLAAARQIFKPENIRKTGIRVEGERVISALSFYVVPPSKYGTGYGISHQIALDPFRTLAADIGAYATSDRRFKGTGGLVPVGTRVFILELAGVRLPDGSLHDGWCVVNDTGGAIFGAHFDVFTGSGRLRKKVWLPHIGHIWFSQNEQRCPPSYTYGLRP